MVETLSEQEIKDLFTREDGSYQFARWGRPVAPVVFGVNDEILSALKVAIKSTTGITGRSLAETDPEMGTNFMWLFIREWSELENVPDLDKLIPNLGEKMKAMEAANSFSYRYFTFDENNAIKFCCNIIRPVDEYAQRPVSVIGATETLLSTLMFGPKAFAKESPMAVLPDKNVVLVKPKYAAVIRAAYEANMPDTADDPSHALRIKARADILIKDLIHET